MSSTLETIDGDEAGLGLEHDGEATRANLYVVLSRAFASPAVMEPNDAERLRQIVPELPRALREPADALARAWDEGLLQQQQMLLAYARLFLGPFEILASPYASFYLEDDQQLMGPVSQAVAEAYAEAGLEPGPGPREAPDHAALEWEFLYFLTYQYLVTGDRQWAERRHVFVSTHVARWMPALGEAISRAQEQPFYDALGVLLAALLKEPACSFVFGPPGASTSLHQADP
jgi:TorA maturation chaperone TorD